MITWSINDQGISDEHTDHQPIVDHIADQDISDWQVHNAYSLNSMFFGAKKFNQESLKKWQISEHADTENMCEWTQQPEEGQQEA